MSDSPNPSSKTSRPGRKRPLAGRFRWPIIALLVLTAILVVAWIDGGEEPIRPIVQPVVEPVSEGAE